MLASIEKGEQFRRRATATPVKFSREEFLQAVHEAFASNA
jgi:hypothetical protein